MNKFAIIHIFKGHNLNLMYINCIQYTHKNNETLLKCCLAAVAFLPIPFFMPCHVKQEAEETKTTVVNTNALKMYSFYKYLWDEPEIKTGVHDAMRCDATTVCTTTKID